MILKNGLVFTEDARFVLADVEIADGKIAQDVYKRQSLDGSDKCVRLEAYMADEHGGENGWKIEKCYMKENSREMLDIIFGQFFIAYAPIESENFQSLPKNLAEKYKEKFRCV